MLDSLLKLFGNSFISDDVIGIPGVANEVSILENGAVVIVDGIDLLGISQPLIDGVDRLNELSDSIGEPITASFFIKIGFDDTKLSALCSLEFFKLSLHVVTPRLDGLIPEVTELFFVSSIALFVERMLIGLEDFIGEV